MHNLFLLHAFEFCMQIFDTITDELAKQHEEHFNVDADEDDSKSGDSSDEEEDIFDTIVDREARRILFDLLHITYHFIRRYKFAQFNEITEIVAAKFEVNYPETHKPLI